MDNTDESTRVLIIGVSSWLGQHLCEYIKHKFPSIILCGTYNRTIPHWIDEKLRYCIDLKTSADENIIADVLRECNPDIIVHLAANTSPMLCEKDSNSAFQINKPCSVISVCKLICPNAVYIFTSTDLVYNGNSQANGKLTEDPINQYGKSKLAFEEDVLSLKYGIVLRLSNMIGTVAPYLPGGCKFLQFLVESAAQRSKIDLRYDEYRSFVLVSDVVAVFSQIFSHFNTYKSQWEKMPSKDKIFNVGGPVGYSRLQLAGIVSRALGIHLQPQFSPDMEVEVKAKIVESLSSNEFQSVDPVESQIWYVGLQSNHEACLLSGIPNPADVTMDSSRSEEFFGLQFHNIALEMSKLLLNCKKDCN